MLSTILLLGLVAYALAISPGEIAFQRGMEAYGKRDFAGAAKWFADAVAEKPSSGGWQNLGLATWQDGRVGEAILAWERAVWLDPAHPAARANLQFARKTAQLESPTHAWHEIPSTWLPANVWAWVGGVSLWVAVGLITLPGFLRRPKTSWAQALAASGLAVFLISLPAQIGAHTRTEIGFVIGPGAALRLSPTKDAETVMQLAPGEPARRERVQGNYVLVRTSRSLGWLESDQFALVCPR